MSAWIQNLEVLCSLKIEAALPVEALESAIRPGLGGAKIQKTAMCTMYLFVLECAIDNNLPLRHHEFIIWRHFRSITRIAFRKMLQTKLLGLHEFKLILGYIEQFLRAQIIPFEGLAKCELYSTDKTLIFQTQNLYQQ
jgi:hypothetical protein